MLAAPYFSVITVCRNARQAIGESVTSLLDQSISDYEYVVVDGASTDGTLEMIQQMTTGKNIQIISERDAGIYDAMNKGIRLARGKWLYFLNAGDRFADKHVLERVMAATSRDPLIELGYGDVIYSSANQQRLVRFNWLSRWNLRFEHLCHQAVFARRDLFGRFGEFNTHFLINADYDWLLRVFLSGAKYAYMDFPIAFYDTAGFSERALAQRVLEREMVRKQHLPRLTGPFLMLLYLLYRKSSRIVGLSTR